MFDFFISLGSACPVAASMAKYGLRSFSGVFDWLITDNLPWVLHYLENDFDDFILRENLERYDDNISHFRDKKSGFYFLHDNFNLETEYEKLKQKYTLRIQTFLERTKSRVCFLRAAADERELSWAHENSDYVKKVIKQKNGESEIVFLIREGQRVPDGFPFCCYQMPGVWRGATKQLLRDFFDRADDFLDFCGENYSALSLIRNLNFDFCQQKTSKVFLDQALTQRRYKTLTKLLSYGFSREQLPEDVIIYGAGTIGKELCRKISPFTSVRCFIDNSKAKAGSFFEGIRIIPEEEMAKICVGGGTKVIVSAAYDFKNIRERLKARIAEENIVSLDEILNLDFGDLDGKGR